MESTAYSLAALRLPAAAEARRKAIFAALEAKKGDNTGSQERVLHRKKVAMQASIMASATPFCFCTTQKHLVAKIPMSSMAYGMIPPMPL